MYYIQIQYYIIGILLVHDIIWPFICIYLSWPSSLSGTTCRRVCFPSPETPIHQKSWRCKPQPKRRWFTGLTFVTSKQKYEKFISPSRMRTSEPSQNGLDFETSHSPYPSVPKKCKQQVHLGLHEDEYLKRVPTKMVESINIRISLWAILLMSCVTWGEGTKSQSSVLSLLQLLVARIRLEKLLSQSQTRFLNHNRTWLKFPFLFLLSLLNRFNTMTIHMCRNN